MSAAKKINSLLLLAGDIVALYASLFLALFIRYGGEWFSQFMTWHITPFTAVFVIWLLIFYVSGLYDLRRLHNNLDFLKTLWLAIIVNGFLSIAIFYLVPSFVIAPKTNLLIFLIVFTVIGTLWRRIFNRYAARSEYAQRIILIGKEETAEEINRVISENKQLGYAVSLWIQENEIDPKTSRLKDMIKKEEIDALIVPRHFKQKSELASLVYELFTTGVHIYDTASFYELIFNKVPLADLEESWFLENLNAHRKYYDDLKRGLELGAAFALGIILLPLEFLIAFLIKMNSPGPIIYSQTRIGKNNQPFTLYKFRTMRKDAEKHGAQWKASGTADPRLTGIGKILVRTHLDELPQLWNILRGELSFVGPRPERPEFVSLLQKEVPHYMIRHLIAPGITGWAQINYKYGASVEDSYRKLEYDIYYLKNRSLILDAAIAIKTLKSFFVNQK